MSAERLRVLWIHHSAVVSAWRRGRVDALADQGVDVTVVAAPRWNEGGAMVDLATAPGEQVVRAGTYGSHPYLFAFNPVPLHQVLRENQFDLIDAHEEPASVSLFEILSLARSTGNTAPVVCYSAQNILKFYPPPFRWFEQRALATVAAIHTCTDDVTGVLAAKKFSGEVINLGLGVDTERFAPTADVDKRSDGPDAPAGASGPLRVGYVGRIEERKGIFTLLAAVGAVERAELAYVGDGPDRDRLESAIATRGLAHQVSVRGYVAHDDLPELYRSFDVMVAHSHDTRSWREQFGRVVVEAMASGVPVVVSDAGALAEVAGGAGIVTPEGDAQCLAEALGNLRDKPELRQDLAARGLARAKHFSWANIAERQAAMYRRVTGRAVRPADR